MKKVKITFEYYLSGDENEIINISAFYTNDNADMIIITNNRIIIEGTRGNKIRPENVLINIKSTLYHQLIKAITYVYLTTGRTFEIGSVVVEVNGEKQEYSTEEIINPCSKVLDKKLLLNKDKCRIIFEKNNMTEKLLTAYIWYIKAYENEDFDYLWKSFNSLYSIISHRDKEFEKLCDVKMFFLTNWNKMVRTNEYMENEDVESLRKLRIREYILNDYENVAKTKAYAEMVKSFEDYRLATLFEQVMPYRKDFLINEKLYDSVNNHIINKKKSGIKKNSDLARFYVLKYTYFLRNKYFHAEKSSPVFILKRNNEIDELDKIREIMSAFIADLFDCNDLYC